MMEFDHDAPVDELARELIARRRAHDGLIDFTKYTLPKYSADPFHHIVAEHLEAVERGEIPRLMIFAPPQHGKSELSTRRFPAWYMGRNPEKGVISASYNADFARGFGRNVRDIIFSREYQNVFPGITIRSDNRAAEEWELEQGGKYFSVGVSSATTGKGAHLFLIDDPIKDRKDADSPTKREDAWNWYRDVVFTRLQDDAAVVMTLTRWHFDDLAGRAEALAASGRGKPWTILRLPALAEPRIHFETKLPILNDDGTVPGDRLGRRPLEPLAPSRFSLESLQEKKEVSGERTWSALYQQVPMSEQGGMFKTSWFGDHTGPLPGRRVRVRAWDLGATIDGDWTVGVLMSRDTDGYFYIENIVRKRGTPHEIERLILDTAHDDGRSVQIWLPQDPGQAGVHQIANLTRKLAGFRVKAQRPTGRKEVRAEPFAAQVEAGNVKLCQGFWKDIFLEEASVFPLGQHDDQIDAASDAFNALLGPRRPVVRDW
ncbi:phage terminase large subunit [uncultured Methylobacterium sp.]|jgi:predicted phage terminase large subunit-like protein|uniref:phage terminase large subunit n=1 Tax=uncultured Methylobacterium sp. TaxID=157278 RepID=UPI0026160A33|nr:phage terminase large subunit [uncultured Methylobacterium sp.]